VTAAYRSKKEALTAFLDKGMTMVHLDARRNGVIVPAQFSNQQELRLNLSYRFSGTEMSIDDSYLEATLTFTGVPFRCRIPMMAIYALTSHVTGAGLVFPESLPEEILSELEHEFQPVQRMDETMSMPKSARAWGGQRRPQGRPTRAPFLRVIDGQKR